MAETSGQLDPLTGLRGIAAYSVLTAHAMDSAFSFAGITIFFNFGTCLAYFGMSLFFVLSGFVIHYNYADSFGR
jgi:peptidoglycan/LPS O-acetylase OafA/YrhL